MFQIKVVTDLATEPVTLQEIKDFLSIDYDDWDSLLTILNKSARTASERVTGKAYGPKLIEVSGNTYTDNTGCVEKVYPITPLVSDVDDWVDADGNSAYRYNAGYSTIPEDLRVAILMRVATGFASRQDSISEVVNKTVNASIITELQYRGLLAG